MATIQSPRVWMAAAASGVLALMLWRRTGSNARDDEEEEWEPVDRDHVVKFFHIINAQSRNQMVSFNQQIAQYRGKIPEQQLAELAVSHFEDQLAKNQTQILNEMGIPEEDMEDASKYYAAEGDPQVQEQVKMLEQMYRAVSGASTEEEAPKLPDNLTEEKMVTVVNAFFAASNTVLRDIVEELVAQGKNPADPNHSMEMSMLLQQRSGPATDEAVKKFNLNSSTVIPAMEKFQESPLIKNAIRVGSEEQQEILNTYGLA